MTLKRERRLEERVKQVADHRDVRYPETVESIRGGHEASSWPGRVVRFNAHDQEGDRDVAPWRGEV